MCGIIGYIGNRHPKEILIEGLKNLEYRGYDSAGIALKNNQTIQIVKSVGKIANLERKIGNSKLIDCNLGIAHTRWATHGIPSEENAHPHQIGKVTIVHNGIIENADELRNDLLTKGIKFKSQTDTEVVCALIDYYYQDDIISAIEKTTKRLKGSYALGVIVEGDSNLYAVRKDSPLIVGVGTNELFIASDIAAIISQTNRYILLEENEIAELSNSSYRVLKEGVEVQKKLQETNISAQETDKGAYEHYMLKEIMEEPYVLEKTLSPYLDNLDALPNLNDYEEIHIVACGSAMYAGIIGKTLLEEKAYLKCYVECASEYRYKTTIYDRKTLVILISQSGETADTIAALRKAHESKIDTLAIVNVKTSTIAREAKCCLFIEAGPEIAVATTKAYILQVALLSLLSYKAAIKKNLVQEINIKNELQKLPKLLNEVLSKKEEYLNIAKKIYQENNIFFIGRKIDYSMCLEGSLKLKEVSYIHSEAYQAGELKHGTISLINEGTPVFAIVTDKDIWDKTISNIEEVKSRGALMIIISTEEILPNCLNIIVPKVSEFFQPILLVPTLQLVAYEVAKLRDCDIDKPKNLAKSVTVE